MKICIIGESKRNDQLYKNLSARYETDYFKKVSEIPSTLSYDILMLPIPSLKQNELINISDNSANISVKELFDRISNNPLIISCNYSNDRFNVVDINKRDDFAYLNAVPTAEGSILYALQNSRNTLFDQTVLITGFGRVAKLLADRLKGLCTKVTICARSQRDLSYAKSLGHSILQLSDLENEVRNFNIIFQTVPSEILSKKILDSVDKKALIVELSSHSIGTDKEYSKKIGLNVVDAPALPEKLFPVSAGNILTEVTESIINEQQISAR